MITIGAKRSLQTLMVTLLMVSCKQATKNDNEQAHDINYIEIVEQDYELAMPETKPNAVLVLFGGYPEVAADIKREFGILKEAKAKGVAVLYTNYNQKLWLEGEDKTNLTQQLNETFNKHQLPNNNVYLGGFSSGGVVTLLMSDFLTGTPNAAIVPKGVFIVDSLIDLAALYRSSEKNVANNFSEVSVNESNWLIETLGKQLGNPAGAIDKYEQHSVFTLQTMNTDNLKHLKESKIRLYTEPDMVWWKENRMADHDQMNAYYNRAACQSTHQQRICRCSLYAHPKQGL